jgi:hypothetical protein
MSQSFRDLILISIATILLALLIWFPHIMQFNSFLSLDFSAGFHNIYRNYDGLEYVIIAKSLYLPELIIPLSPTLSPSYYASHFPGYSIFILLFSPFLGFLKSMLFVSVLSTIAAACAFYLFVKRLNLTEHPLVLSLIFLIIPARWLIIHSVGSSEPTFIFFVIVALYFFIRYEQTGHISDIYLSAFSGLGAQLTRPPGILLFIALGLYILWRHIIAREEKQSLIKAIAKILKYYPLLLIPLSLIGLFYWFHISYNDFFAYFHSGDNIHLTLPPFPIFNKAQYWVGDIWLEDIVYIYLFGLLGGVYLIKQKLYPLAFFVFTFIAATIFVAHRDISRYVMPIFPFVLIAFEKVLTSKDFRIVLIVLALGIYLYAQNFIINNTAPIPNLDIFD